MKIKIDHQDIDECAEIGLGIRTDFCVANADCYNMPGSYGCMCHSGYSGDGLSTGLGCNGKFVGSCQADEEAFKDFENLNSFSSL